MKRGGAPRKAARPKPFTESGWDWASRDFMNNSGQGLGIIAQTLNGLSLSIPVQLWREVHSFQFNTNFLLLQSRLIKQRSANGP